MKQYTHPFRLLQLIIAVFAAFCLTGCYDNPPDIESAVPPKLSGVWKGEPNLREKITDVYYEFTVGQHASIKIVQWGKDCYNSAIFNLSASVIGKDTVLVVQQKGEDKSYNFLEIVNLDDIETGSLELRSLNPVGLDDKSLPRTATSSSVTAGLARALQKGLSMKNGEMATGGDGLKFTRQNLKTLPGIPPNVILAAASKAEAESKNAELLKSKAQPLVVPDSKESLKLKSENSGNLGEAYSIVLIARQLIITVEMETDLLKLNEIKKELVSLLQLTNSRADLRGLAIKSLLTECARYVEARSSFIEEMLRIGSVMEAKAKQDGNAALGKAAEAWFFEAIKEAMKDEEKQSGLRPLAAAAVKGAESATELKARRDSAQKSEELTAGQLYRSACTTFYANCSKVSSAISQQIGRPVTELGFDTIGADVAFYLNNPSGSERLAKFRSWRNSRPSDPFLESGTFSLQIETENSDIAVARAAAKTCESGAKRLPVGAEFSKWRAMLSQRAGQCLETSLVRSYPYESSWGGIKSEDALLAVGYFSDSYMTYKGNADQVLDSMAEMSFLGGKLEQALTFTRAASAVSGYKGSSRAALKRAQMQAVAGKAKDAFASLRVLFKDYGYANLSFLRGDKDIASLRKTNSADLDDLFKLKFSWSIKYGVLSDDIVLVNESEFGLTNVTLTCKLSQGSKEWNKTLTVKEMLPGYQTKWSDVVSIPGSKLDAATASLTSDQ